MTSTMLYFGSFNPPHNGHTAVARYVLEQGLCDELWFVVSPRNPFKSDAMLAGELDRLRMVEIAVDEQLAQMPVRVSDIEFGLPRPSYTIDTLGILRERFPENEFSLLVGTDIIAEIDGWKEPERLLSEYRFYVYPRAGYTLDKVSENIVFLKDAPMFDCSSTEVRAAVREGRDIGGMVSPGVQEYIEERRLWK